jgi:hypothetical protein
MESSRLFRRRVWSSAFSCALSLFLGCSAQQMAFPDCNCTPQKAAIDEVSIHTLQTAKFTKAQLIKYMHGKCLTIDSVSGYLGEFVFSPVLICGVPGELQYDEHVVVTNTTTREFVAPRVDSIIIKSYGFTTNLDYVDSTSKKLGITLPSSITTKSALRDTFAHRIHAFEGPENDSTALYWHGIFLGWHPSGFVDIQINDSTWWSYCVSHRYDKKTGP